MRPNHGFQQRCVDYLRVHAAALVLACAWASPSLTQQAPQNHPPMSALVNVPRVVVPDVRGRQLTEAREILQRAGLKPGTMSADSGPGIVGTVLRQEPQQNSVVLRGTVFNLVLVAPSKQQEPGDGDQEFSRQVPKLTGLSLNEASNLLERSRLELGNVSAGPGKGAPGTVYAQRPQAGTWVKTMSRIDVEIVELPKSPPAPAKVPILVFVPNLFGQTSKGAEQVLIEHGLSLGSVSSGSASVTPGTIFRQEPVANSRVAQGTQVHIEVARPPQKTTVAVPELVHLDVQMGKALLAQVGLQLGAVTNEESESPRNSITAQSPNAGTQVERGASVDLIVAQGIPAVEVPSLAGREEADAQAVLQTVGLQMGTVSEHEAAASSGTVLSQRPSAGEHVRKGTAVDLVVSRQIPSELTVMIDHSNPQKDKILTFHSHLEPLQRGVKYRFTFGDGQATNWLTDSKAQHTYKKAGDFQVQAFAQKGDTTVSSEMVMVTIPGSGWASAAGLTVGVLALGGGAYFYHGRRLFQKWIRAVPKPDLGTPHLFMDNESLGNETVCIRVAYDIGEQSVSLTPESRPEKEGTK